MATGGVEPPYPDFQTGALPLCDVAIRPGTAPATFLVLIYALVKLKNPGLLGRGSFAFRLVWLLLGCPDRVCGAIVTKLGGHVFANRRNAVSPRTVCFAHGGWPYVGGCDVEGRAHGREYTFRETFVK